MVIGLMAYASVATGSDMKPVIMTSIKPVALLTQAVVKDLAEVDILLVGDASAHHVTLRVSDRRRLEQADLLVWMGANLERYLVPLAAGQESLALGVVNADATGAANHEKHHHADHDDATDPHVWLNPSLAHQMLSLIAHKMAQLDPDNAVSYRHNAQLEQDKINAVMSDLRARLEPQRSALYGVTHNAYGHLLDYFQFPVPLIITDSPEIPPSAKRLWEIGHKLTPKESCVLVEPAYSRGWIVNWAARNDYRMVVMDILASRSEATDYSQWMTEVVDSFERCVTVNR